jgi:cysteine-rich repeat protein
VNPLPAAGDRFGAALAASGRIVVVGAPGDDGAGPDAGAVYVFDATTGGLLFTLRSPRPAPGEHFGAAVAIADGALVVGAPGGGAGSGVVYLFGRGTGGYLLTLGNPSPAPNDAFGAAVVVVGSRLVVGAPNDDTGAEDAGAAYLFDPDTGALERTIPNPSTGRGDHFGAAAAALGSAVTIGAPDDDGGAADAGAVYVLTAATGVLRQTIPNPSPGTGDHFGAAIGVVDDAIVVGAPDDDGVAADVGSAYVFAAATGLLARPLLNPSPRAGARFGAAIAGAPGLAALGAPGAGADARGAAYLFEPATGRLAQSLSVPLSAAGARTGAAVAARGGAIFVGAPSDAAPPGGPGTFHLFDACGTGLVTGREQCDDGNVLGGDGCAADCRLEPPTPTPTVTVTPSAGAGTPTPGGSASTAGVSPAVAPLTPSATPSAGGLVAAPSSAAQCRRALARAGRTLAAGEHKRLQRCLDRVLATASAGQAPTAAALACDALDASVPGSAAAQARAGARATIARQCAGLAAADVGNPCDAAATTIDALAACVLERHVAGAYAEIASAYGDAGGLLASAEVREGSPALAAERAVPVASKSVRACRAAIVRAARAFATAVHVRLDACLSAFAGAPADALTAFAPAACRGIMASPVGASDLERRRARAAAQIARRCAAATVVELGSPCDPGAGTVADVAACILDHHAAGAATAIASVYPDACARLHGVGAGAGVLGGCADR